MSVYERWLNLITRHHKNLDITFIEKACNFAEKNEDDTQGIQIGQILLELNCDHQTIAAGILYPTFYHRPTTKDSILHQFDAEIYKLLSGVKRMESIHAISKNSLEASFDQSQLDNLRKMLLAIADDVRIVLIKLAERLAILKHLKYLSPDQQKPIANQAMEIYAPLANRLGIGYLKWQIEDLSFRYMNNEIYGKISKELNMRRHERDRFIHEMEKKLQDLFKTTDIERVEFSGRSKHIYSIYRKMSRKDVSFSEIYDTSAFRILVPTIKDCYTALSIVHSKWEHIPKEFDDYIAKPKPNGYRSIHTVLIGPKNINVEIQIRTFKMHEEAELGVAAHWKYKESSTTKSTFEEKISLLRDVLDWQMQISVNETENKNLYSEIFKDRIYVFSPNGDIYDLEAGSTPLDFAYHVHSSIGHRCRGAKVNGNLVALSQALQTGDQVEIITSKIEKPSRDWLNPNLGYIKSKHALSKVRHWFKKELYEENHATGQAIWEKISKREGITKSKLSKVIGDLNYKNLDDLIAALGAGDISAIAILNHLRAKEGSAPTQIIIEKPIKKKEKTEKSKFMIEGVGNVLTQLARCCKPIPGDSIIGYVTRGRGVTIHKTDCYNIKKIIDIYPDRILKVSWGKDLSQAYIVDLLIESNDRSGLLRDITSVIANENVSLLGINSRVNKLDNLATIYLTIEMKSDQSLEKILSLLKQIPDIAKVVRR